MQSSSFLQRVLLVAESWLWMALESSFSFGHVHPRARSRWGPQANHTLFWPFSSKGIFLQASEKLGLTCFLRARRFCPQDTIFPLHIPSFICFQAKECSPVTQLPPERGGGQKVCGEAGTVSSWTLAVLGNFRHFSFCHFHIKTEYLCLPQNSYVEIPTPKAMVSGDGSSGRWWGHEGSALRDGICALLKETPEGSLPLLPHDITVKDSHLRARKGALTRLQVGLPWSWTFSHQNYEK